MGGRGGCEEGDSDSEARCPGLPCRVGLPATFFNPASPYLLRIAKSPFSSRPRFFLWRERSRLEGFAQEAIDRRHAAGKVLVFDRHTFEVGEARNLRRHSATRGGM